MEEGFRACPHCAEPIREAATICRYCNRAIGAVSQSTAPAPEQPGRAAQRQEQTGPVATRKAWATVFALAGLVGMLFFGAWVFTHSKNSPDNDGPASDTPSASGAPVLEPPPTPIRVSVLSGTLEVDANQIRWFDLTIPANAKKAAISGQFHAFGGQGNDIWLVVTDAFDFENWKNNHETRLFYNSGKVTNGLIAVQGLPPGQYVLAFDNRFSAFSRKEVTGEITLTYLLAPSR